MTRGLYGWTFGPQRFTLLFYLYVKFFNDGEEKKKTVKRKNVGVNVALLILQSMCASQIVGGRGWGRCIPENNINDLF